jgi:hypothetical protein
MATIALFAAASSLAPAGTLFGGALTYAALFGSVGAAVGGFIDNRFLFPALFGDTLADQDILGPRLDEMRLQTASEGSNVKKVWSNRNRIAGTLIWVSDLIEEEVVETQELGGKGGAPSATQTQTSYNYYVHVAVAVCEGPLNDNSISDNGFVRIWADDKPIFQWNRPFYRGDSITFYAGDESQTPDSLIEATEGTGEVPAYRGIAYFVIEKLALADFGNRIPNFTAKLYEHDLTVSSFRTQADVVSGILDDQGYETDQYDVTKLTSATGVRGYNYGGPQQGSKKLEPILLAYDVLVRDSGGKLWFMNRGEEDTITINSDDIGAHEFDDRERSPTINLRRVSGIDLPARINVGFIDESRDFQEGSVIARRFLKTLGSANVNMPLALTSSQARNIGERYLWQAWQESMRGEFVLPPRHVNVEETDLIAYPFDGEVYTVRAERVARGVNGLIEISGAVQDAETFDQDVTMPDDPFPEPDPYEPPDTTLVILQLGALNDAQYDTPGYYVACCASDASAEWQGAATYSSTDDSNWGTVSSANVETKVGVTQSTLGDASIHTWDRINTLDVEMYHGELTSASEEQVLAGVNAMVVGDEIIGFCTATLTGTNPTTGAKQYTLSQLLRGRVNTGGATAGHGATEEVVLLESSLVQFVSHQASSIGDTRYWRCVAKFADIGDYASQSASLNGSTVTPWSVAKLKGVRDGSDNIDVTWSRRTRLSYNLFSTSEFPLDEPFEQYDVEYYDGSDNLLRTEAGLTSPADTYTAAEQTTDGITPGDTVKIKVYQRGNLVTRGQVAQYTVT